MLYLPQTTSPFLISLPTWKTRFLLPCFHFSHILCHRPELWMFLLWGVLTHPSSNLGPHMFIYFCYPVAGCISHNQEWALECCAEVKYIEYEFFLPTSQENKRGLIIPAWVSSGKLHYLLGWAVTLPLEEPGGPPLVKLCLLFTPHCTSKD